MQEISAEGKQPQVDQQQEQPEPATKKRKKLSAHDMGMFMMYPFQQAQLKHHLREVEQCVPSTRTTGKRKQPSEGVGAAEGSRKRKQTLDPRVLSAGDSSRVPSLTTLTPARTLFTPPSPPADASPEPSGSELDVETWLDLLETLGSPVDSEASAIDMSGGISTGTSDNISAGTGTGSSDGYGKVKGKGVEGARDET